MAAKDSSVGIASSIFTAESMASPSTLGEIISSSDSPRLHTLCCSRRSATRFGSSMPHMQLLDPRVHVDQCRPANSAQIVMFVLSCVRGCLERRVKWNYRRGLMLFERSLCALLAIEIPTGLVLGFRFRVGIGFAMRDRAGTVNAFALLLRMSVPGQNVMLL